MRFRKAGRKHEKHIKALREAGWHTHFAWGPKWCVDIQSYVWLERVFRRLAGVIEEGFYNDAARWKA